MATKYPRDPVAVLRAIAGDPPEHYNRNDRIEAIQIMLAAGVPRRLIAERLRISVPAARRACGRIAAKQRGAI